MKLSTPKSLIFYAHFIAEKQKSLQFIHWYETVYELFPMSFLYSTTKSTVPALFAFKVKMLIQPWTDYILFFYHRCFKGMECLASLYNNERVIMKNALFLGKKEKQRLWSESYKSDFPDLQY